MLSLTVVYTDENDAIWKLYVKCNPCDVLLNGNVPAVHSGKLAFCMPAPCTLTPIPCQPRHETTSSE